MSVKHRKIIKMVDMGDIFILKGNSNMKLIPQHSNNNISLSIKKNIFIG